MKRSNVFGIIAVCLLALVSSCSDDNEDLSPIEPTIVQIPDSRFEMALINLGIDSDGEVNQSLLLTDAQKVSALELNPNGDAINSLKGIEAFKNLKKLSVFRQDMGELDLSKNVNLDSLILVGNALETIDLTSNKNLKYIDLTSNLLSSVYGLDGLLELKELRLSFNELESFQVNNPSIEDLLISHNKLKSFDASGSIRLKRILIKLNELGSLDLSANSSLEFINASSNGLQELSLPDSDNLNYLYVNHNDLMELDVSNYRNLVGLKVFNNSSLQCIKVDSGQEIPSVDKSDYQELNVNCN